MGWFDEQIRQRMHSDEELLEDSLLQMAGAVLDRWKAERILDGQITTREALDEILKYYHRKPVEIPRTVRDPLEEVEYALRPSGLMIREVHLEPGWQRDAWGPMIAFLKESGATVALLPGAMHGYRYRDPATGETRRVTAKNAGEFSKDAICFYRPLPMKKLGIRDLLVYMKNCVGNGDVLLLLAALAVTLVCRIEPRIYSLVTGPVLRDRRMSLAAGLGSLLVASAFASEMIGMVRNLLAERIRIKTSQAVEASVMMRILALPVSFFRRFAAGELASRAMSVSTLCGLLLENILTAGLSALMSLLYLPDIFRYAPGLAWPAAGLTALTFLISVAAALMRIGIVRQKMELEAEEAGMGYAMLSGIRKIRLSGSEKRFFARWGALYARIARLEYHPPAFLKLHRVLITAVSLAGTVLLYWLAVRTGVSGNEFYAFSAAFGRLMGAFTALAGVAASLAEIPPVLEMAAPILEAEPESGAGKEAFTRLSGSVEVSHVSFRYAENTAWILNDLSLRVQPGEYVAVVGRTGCGKSTLVRLLLGFERPEKGAVFYDRRDLSGMDPRTLRRQIGVVIQNGELMQGDIFSNITLSAPQLTLEEAWEAAEVAGIAEDIREMPMGMQTVLSEGQGGVSGGQKQRLLIARAVAPKPKILILDEATSALDNRTQKQVADALDRLKCTRIVIAHRLSTIRNCDRILMMENGTITEEGTYESLMARGGAFARLVERQQPDAATA